MSNWEQPGAGYYPGQQGYPYPPQQNPNYPPPQGGYPGYPPTYPPTYPGGNLPPPGFIVPGQVPNQPAMYQSAGHPEDPGRDEVKNFEFSDKTIRAGFIKKVYSILMCQLLITLGMISLFMFHEPTKLYVQQHRSLVWITLIATFVLLICMACCTSVRRKAPTNFIFLFLFTVAEGFLLATISSAYNKEEVLFAVGITAAVCLGLTMFAFQTKWDFTGLSSVLFVAVLVLFIFGLVAMFFPGKTMKLVYGCLGALVFSIYLIYDTQMMMGGNHKYSISPEEYIFAALTLYIDVVNIFLYILTIIGASRD